MGRRGKKISKEIISFGENKSALEFLEGARPFSGIQTYTVADTPQGGPPFHHDILIIILVYAGNDLRDLVTLSAVRRSWRFFTNYLCRWRVFTISNNYLPESSGPLFGPVSVTRHYPRGKEMDFEDYQSTGRLYTRDIDLHSQFDVWKNNAQAAEDRRLEEARNAERAGRKTKKTLTSGLCIASFAIVFLLACLPLASVASQPHEDRYGKILFRRIAAEHENTTLWSKDAQIGLVGLEAGNKAKRSSSWLNLTRCSSAVPSSQTCKTSRSGKPGSKNRKTKRSCKTNYLWGQCPNLSGELESCGELQSVAKRSSRILMAFSLMTILSPVLLAGVSVSAACLGLLDEPLFLKVLFFALALPLQSITMALAISGFYYSNVLKTTPCPALSVLFPGEIGPGITPTIKALHFDSTGWLSMMTVPSMMAAIVIALSFINYGLILFWKITM